MLLSPAFSIFSGRRGVPLGTATVFSERVQLTIVTLLDREAGNIARGGVNYEFFNSR